MIISLDKVKIAFQGMEGAYSNMACKECFPNAVTIACSSFESMIETTKNNDADFAMVPVENSIAGRVADIHTLIPDSGLSLEQNIIRRLTINFYHCRSKTLKTLNSLKVMLKV